MAVPEPIEDARAATLDCPCPEPDCAGITRVGAGDLGRAIACSTCGRAFAALSLDIRQKLAERAAGAPRRVPDDAARIVVVDGVRSQWNVGSVFRTCDGAGWDHVALCGITPTPASPGVAKTALGAQGWVSWSYHPSGIELLDALAGRGISCIALEQTAAATPLPSVTLPERAALVIGNEVHGVSPELLRRCDVHVQIPMHGRKDSLNVAVAFGIAAYGGRR